MKRHELLFHYRSALISFQKMKTGTHTKKKIKSIKVWADDTICFVALICNYRLFFRQHPRLID